MPVANPVALAHAPDAGYRMPVMTLLRPLVAILWTALPGIAAAHPHVFIDTGLALTLNDSREVTSIEVTWKYDDLYSLLVMQDMGLDEDGDGQLTPEELTQVTGWDMDWMEGYEGDLYLAAPDGAAVHLGPPEPVETRVEAGRLVSVHRRPVVPPVRAEGLSLRAFDPEFYTAYDLSLGVSIPAPCRATVTAPDQDKAYKEAETVMSAFPEDAEQVPLLGHIFAATVTLSCASDQ